MRVGVPREIKNQEHRVGLIPASVRELVHHGHAVLVERGAGVGIGFCDDDYRAAGADIADTPDEVFARADMVVKVKEPQPQEFGLLRSGQILFTYLHLAAEPEVPQALIDADCVAIAYRR
jgi:alanine dehydrogenase